MIQKNLPTNVKVFRQIRLVVNELKLTAKKCDDGNYYVVHDGKQTVCLTANSCCRWNGSERVDCGVESVTIKLVDRSPSIYRTRTFRVRKDGSFNWTSIATGISTCLTNCINHDKEHEASLRERERKEKLIKKASAAFMNKWKKYKPRQRHSTSTVTFEKLNIDVWFYYSSDLDTVIANIDTEQLLPAQVDLVFDVAKDYATKWE